ncbi:MAG: sigma-70 family RNA polymerase sigma factor [Rhodospirillaceae bacterium]|nr:sigma-70 family RNA polymerase sigma factor [Rhodospirillaceae bacterium]
MTAFQTELETLLPDLARFARVLTRNEDDSHDLVQDCVERALRKQDLFQQGTSLKSWLFTLMRNVFISQKRRETLDRRYVAMADDGNLRVQVPGQVNSVFLKQTMRALRRLSSNERQAIIVLGVHEGNQHDVARAMNEPVGTVKSRLCRGRAHLRATMGIDDAMLATA